MAWAGELDEKYSEDDEMFGIHLQYAGEWLVIIASTDDRRIIENSLGHYIGCLPHE